jgi:2-C-methyl-D-erythritol 4-phosphate cytidylyltransferase
VTTDTISRLLQICTDKDSATIGHPMTDYVQFDLSGGTSRYLDRNSIIAMQSPEAHKFRLMRQVFEAAAAQNHALTESCCTMLLHNMGFSINFVKSHINNIKITTEEDFAIL